MDHGSAFEELGRYMGLTEADEARLALLLGPLEARIGDVLDEFYGAILRHPAALAAFREPDAQIPRQRALLAGWLRGVLAGPHDAAHYERTERVGRAHVVHRLPQRYMHGGMNILRRGLVGIAFETQADRDELRATIDAWRRANTRDVDGAVELDPEERARLEALGYGE